MSVSKINWWFLYLVLADTKRIPIAIVKFCLQTLCFCIVDYHSFFSWLTMSLTCLFPSPSCLINPPQSINLSNKWHSLLRLKKVIFTEPGFSSTSKPYLVRPRTSLCKMLKTSCAIGRSKMTIHGCTLLILGDSQRSMAHFARIMQRCSIGYSSPSSRIAPKFPFTANSATLFSRLNVISRSLHLCPFAQILTCYA